MTVWGGLESIVQAQRSTLLNQSTTPTPHSFRRVCVARVVGIEPRRAYSVVGALPLPGVYIRNLPPTWLRLRPRNLPSLKDGRMCANSGGRPAEVTASAQSC